MKIILNECKKYIKIRQVKDSLYRFNEYQDKLKIQLLKIENEMMTVNRALNENPNSKKNKSKLNQLNMQLSSINNRISKTEELLLEDGPVFGFSCCFIYMY